MERQENILNMIRKLKKSELYENRGKFIKNNKETSEKKMLKNLYLK